MVKSSEAFGAFLVSGVFEAPDTVYVWQVVNVHAALIKIEQ